MFVDAVTYHPWLKRLTYLWAPKTQTSLDNLLHANSKYDTQIRITITQLYHHEQMKK